MYYLPSSKQFGKLTIKTEYHTYDIPRTFLVESSLNKSQYLVFWVDECPENDTWFYAKTNSEEILKLENGLIPLRDVFLQRNIYEVITPFDESLPINVKEVRDIDIDQSLLPPEGFALQKTAEANFEIIERDKDSFTLNDQTHGVKIYRTRSKKSVSWAEASAILGVWEKIYNSIVDGLGYKDALLAPQGSGIGSYKMDFKAEHNQEMLMTVMSFIRDIDNQDSNLKEISKFIDPLYIEELFNTLNLYKFKFDLLSHTGQILFTFDPTKLSATVQNLKEYNQVNVWNDVIPQANELTRILKLVECLGVGEQFDSSSENITPRQIDYYITAARLLGLIRENEMSLTPLGWRVFNCGELTDKYITLAEAFELSECGWAWMKFSKVSSVYELDPFTASDFLLSCSKGLSEDTAKRRSTTLSKWIKTFQEYKPSKTEPICI